VPNQSVQAALNSTPDAQRWTDQHMIFILVTFYAFLFSALGQVEATSSFDPYSGPKPVAVLVEMDPWLMVLGSDTPSFALYENRLAIQLRRKQAGEGYEYVAQTLDEDVYSELLARLRSLTAGTPWKPTYDAAPGITDQGTTSVYVRTGGTAVVTQVYGFNTKGFGQPSIDQRLSKAAANVPTNLRALVKELRTFSLPAAQRWQPQYIEVMLWPYQHAPDPSIAWPARWPGLKSKWSKNHGDDFYSIYLPGKELVALEQFLSSRKPRGAVELEGRKWSVDYRFVFPREPEWREAFSWDRK